MKATVGRQGGAAGDMGNRMLQPHLVEDLGRRQDLRNVKVKLLSFVDLGVWCFRLVDLVDRILDDDIHTNDHRVFDVSASLCFCFAL